MIHFMMILVNFGVFSLMLTDIRTEPRTDQRTDGRTDRPSYRDARTHLKTLWTNYSVNLWVLQSLHYKRSGMSFKEVATYTEPGSSHYFTNTRLCFYPWPAWLCRSSPDQEPSHWDRKNQAIKNGENLSTDQLCYPGSQEAGSYYGKRIYSWCYQ